ncbi:MAG: pyridoxal-dependent decarboxylase [Bacteroidota bacterium]
MMDLSQDERRQVWSILMDRLESYYSATDDIPVTREFDQEKLLSHVTSIDFDSPVETATAIDHVVDGLKKYAVHTPHPSYFGLFNPRPNFPSIIADVITATLNPQMAAWSHAPFAATCEYHMIQEMGSKMGWSRQTSAGTFCSGGAEANLTAVLASLTHKYPRYQESGAVGLLARPRIYTSAHSHHSIARAARIAGLGMDAVSMISTDSNLRMDLKVLSQQIIQDKSDGHDPLMVAATAGTTGPGSIDPLSGISDICRSLGLWMHVDAAYGGAMRLWPEGRHHLDGIDGADSITFDIHKWLNVPMAASLFLTRHTDILQRTFRIAAAYMPPDSDSISQDPYTSSIQWSRRFIGLKLYMTLACFGWKGIAEMIQSTCQLGDVLRERLVSQGWQIDNATPMPIICFSHPELDNDQIVKICDKIVRSGKAWISTYPIDGRICLRACITNYKTGIKEIKELVSLLQQVSFSN